MRSIAIDDECASFPSGTPAGSDQSPDRWQRCPCRPGPRRSARCRLPGLAEDVDIPHLNSRPLARDPLAALLAPDHRLSARKRIRLEAIADEEFVDFPAGTTGRIQADRAFLAAGLERTVAFEITDPYVMARLVTEGLGVALLASAYAERLPGVAVVPVVNTSYRIEHLIWSRLGPTPAANAFIARAAGG